MYVVYSALIVVFFLVVSPYLLYQAIRYRKYVTSLLQRLGILPVSFNSLLPSPNRSGSMWR